MTLEATETLMCAAVPAASLTPGRNRRTCASQAHEAVRHGVVERPVCVMHLRAWDRATPEQKEQLALRWGW